MTPDKNGYLSHRQILVVMTGLLLGMFLASLDQSIVSTALPRVTSDLGGLDKLSWVVTAYLLTSTASTPLWGKISDLYGRRLLFQAAIVTFIIGSLLSGISQNMEQLIAFRAFQGLGGGGLIAIGMATIGDVIPPRERPRYQGYSAAVFGMAAVLGPVLGGFFADGPGWRWIFWINVPIGMAAFVVTTLSLKIQHVRRDHTIDYLGAGVIVAGVTSLLLYTAWAGPDLGWSAPGSLALLLGGLSLAVAFVFIELHAKEPIIPMALFKNPIFRVSTSYIFLVGASMFGVVVFMPLYLQIVKGFSPTESGLGMLPMVIGMFGTSMTVGRIVSRTGHYKWYPAIGGVTVLVAVLLLSQLQIDSPYWYVALAAFIMGSGIGMSGQIVVVAVQNSVPREDMGTATSSVQFFRSMGGSFGTAMFGAVLTSRLAVHLDDALGGANIPGNGAPDSLTSNVSKIQHLADPLHDLVTGAFDKALSEVYLTAIPLILLAIVIGAFMKQIPLASRESEPHQDEDVELTEPSLV